jgi:hypothetical protein
VTAVLEADWQIWEGSAGSPSSSGHFRQSLDAPNGASFEQLAPLLGQLTERFANSLNEVLQPAIDRVEVAGTKN